MRTILCMTLASLLALAGCAQHRLCHATKTQDDFTHENYLCQIEAMQRGGSVAPSLLFNPFERTLYNNCMGKKFGWTPCDSPSQAGADQGASCSPKAKSGD